MINYLNICEAHNILHGMLMLPETGSVPSGASAVVHSPANWLLPRARPTAKGKDKLLLILLDNSLWRVTFLTVVSVHFYCANPAASKSVTKHNSYLFLAPDWVGQLFELGSTGLAASASQAVWPQGLAVSWSGCPSLPGRQAGACVCPEVEGFLQQQMGMPWCRSPFQASACVMFMNDPWPSKFWEVCWFREWRNRFCLWKEDLGHHKAGAHVWGGGGRIRA